MGVLLLLLRLLCVVLAVADAVLMVVGLAHAACSLTAAAAAWSSTVLDAWRLRDALRIVSLRGVLTVDSTLVVLVIAVFVVVTIVLVSGADAVFAVLVAVSGVAFGGVGCGLLRQLLSLYIYKPKSHKIVRAIK